MNQKIKVLIVVGILAVILAVVTPVLSSTSATSSWTNEVITDADITLQKAGYQIKENLVNQDVTEQMKQALNPLIESEIAELERLLESYYQMQLENLTDTPEYLAVQERIKVIRNQVAERFKKEIDKAFE